MLELFLLKEKGKQELKKITNELYEIRELKIKEPDDISRAKNRLMNFVKGLGLSEKEIKELQEKMREFSTKDFKDFLNQELKKIKKGQEKEYSFQP